MLRRFRMVPPEPPERSDAAGTSVVSDGFIPGSERNDVPRRFGACIRCREFADEWRGSDTAKAKSANQRITQIRFYRAPNKEIPCFYLQWSKISSIPEHKKASLKIISRNNSENCKNYLFRYLPAF
jgi:hypothetical protein